MPSEIRMIGHCELRRVGCQRRWRCTECERWGPPGQREPETLADIQAHHLAGCTPVVRPSRGQAAFGRRGDRPVAVQEVRL